MYQCVNYNLAACPSLWLFQVTTARSTIQYSSPKGSSGIPELLLVSVNEDTDRCVFYSVNQPYKLEKDAHVCHLTVQQI